MSTPPPAPPERLRAVTAEMDHLLWVLADLRNVLPGPLLPPPFIALLMSRYQQRYAVCYGEWMSLGGTPAAVAADTADSPGSAALTTAPNQGLAGAPTQPVPAPPGAEFGPPSVAGPTGPTAPTAAVPGAGPALQPPTFPAAVGPAPVPCRAPPQPAPVNVPREPWLRPFLADNAVLVFSGLGAFLLVIATLLFEAYGPDVGGVAHFAAVIGLNAVFGAAAVVCLRRSSLRIVGRTYAAIFALLQPITLLAADRLLGLTERGLTPATALSLGAGYCTLVYAVLGVRLAEKLYAALAEFAFIIGWIAALFAVGESRWTGPALAAPLMGLAVLDARRWTRADVRLLAAPAALVRDVAAALALFAAVIATWRSPAAGLFGLVDVEMSAALLGVTIAYAVSFLVSRRPRDGAVAIVGVSATTLAGVHTFGFGNSGAAVALAVLALVLSGMGCLPAFAIVNETANASGRRQFLRAAHTRHALAAWSAVHAVVATAFVEHSSAAVAASVAAVAALTGVVLSLSNRRPEWMLTGVVSLATAWAIVQGFPPLVPAGLAVTAGGLAAYALLKQAPRLIGPAAAAAALAVLSTGHILGAGTRVVEVELLALAAAVTAVCRPSPAASRAGLRVVAASLVALGGAPVLSVGDGLVAVVAAAGVATALAVEAAEEAWLVAALGWLGVWFLLLGAPVDVLFSRVGDPLWILPAGLAALTAGVVVTAVVLRRRPLWAAVPFAVSATVMTANHAFRASEQATLAQLVLLAALTLATVRLIEGSTGRTLLRWKVGVQLAIAAAVVSGPDWFEAVLVVGAVVVAIGLAYESRAIVADVLATALGIIAWFWIARAVAPNLPVATGGDVALVYAPVPSMFAAGAALVSAQAGERRRALSTTLMTAAAAVALFSLSAALGDQRWGLAGGLLFLAAVTVFLAGLAWRRAECVPVTVGCGALAAWAFMVDRNLPVAADLVGLAGAAALGYQLHALYPASADWLPWRRLQRFSAIAVGGLVALTPVMLPAAYSASGIPLAAFTAGALFCAVVADEGRLSGRQILLYAAALGASLAAVWLLVAAHLASFITVSTVPGLALLGLGWAARSDAKLPVTAAHLRAAFGTGACLVLGSSGLEALADGTASHLSLVLLEGVAAVIMGIGLRQRVLVLVGSTAVAGTGLRALLVAAESVPPYAIFGGTALVLLVLAGCLAGSRQRLELLQASARRSWDRWD